MDHKASEMRYGLRCLIILSLFGVTGISVNAQHMAPWPAVYQDGNHAGHLYDVVSCDISEDNLYMVDTVYILSQKTALYIPVYVCGVDKDRRYTPYWTVRTKDATRRTAVLEFDSSISGDVYCLEIKRKNSRLYVVEAIMFWMNSSYAYHLSEDDVIHLSSVQICHKKVNELIQGVLVFNDYFEESDDFERYYCPKKYPLEKCLEMMRRGHKFKFQDFEEE